MNQYPHTPEEPELDVQVFAATIGNYLNKHNIPFQHNTTYDIRARELQVCDEAQIQALNELFGASGIEPVQAVSIGDQDLPENVCWLSLSRDGVITQYIAAAKFDMKNQSCDSFTEAIRVHIFSPDMTSGSQQKIAQEIVARLVDVRLPEALDGTADELAVVRSLTELIAAEAAYDAVSDALWAELQAQYLIEEYRLDEPQQTDLAAIGIILRQLSAT